MFVNLYPASRTSFNDFPRLENHFPPSPYSVEYCAGTSGLALANHEFVTSVLGGLRGLCLSRANTSILRVLRILRVSSGDTRPVSWIASVTLSASNVAVFSNLVFCTMHVTTVCKPNVRGSPEGIQNDPTSHPNGDTTSLRNLL